MITKIATPLLFLALLSSPCLAKEKPGSPPQVVVSDVQITPTGELLFAIKIFASTTKPLSLNGGIPEPDPEASENPSSNSDPIPLPLTLNGSTLTDVRTKVVYANLPTLPPEPFVGAMETLTTISAGGWIQMGIAFPPLPPPIVKKGIRWRYKLRLDIPQLKLSTVIKLDPDTLKPIATSR